MANCTILSPYDVRHHTSQSSSSLPDPPQTQRVSTLPPRARRPVRPHLQPPPLPGCDAHSAWLFPPRRPADWQLPAPIRRRPGSGAGPQAGVALSVQVEAPGGAKWQEPLIKGESGGGQERGPARPSQVSAPSGPGEPGPPGADPGRDGVRDGWTHSLGPGPSRGWGEIWC